MSAFPWAPADVEKLRTLAGEGFSASQIAYRLGGGLTRNAVIGKAHRIRLKLTGKVHPLPDGGARPAERRKPEVIAPRPIQARAPRASAAPSAPAQAPAPVALPAPAPIHFSAPAPSETSNRRVAAAPPAPEPFEIAFGPVTIFDLGDHHCRFIAGPVDGSATLYCGGARSPGSRYCADHRDVVRGSGTPSERTALSGFGLTKRAALTGAYK